MNALLLADQMSELPPPTEVPAMPSPPRPEPRFVRSIDFAALPTAILCTRLFVASTLTQWGARFLEADAELLAVELVRHSVETCGVTTGVPLYELEHLNVIRVRLLGFARTIGIEVWDNADQPGALSASYQEGELQGLALVDTRAREWGSVVTPHGRVTWAALDVYERAASGLPVRTPRPMPYPHPSIGDGGHPDQGIELLRRVRNGLEGL